VVDDLAEDGLGRHPRPDCHLLVLHTHAHGHHVAGDGQFSDRPDTTLVGADLRSAWRYFGFDEDPEAVVHVDLGGRLLECLATPGHHEAASPCTTDGPASCSPGTRSIPDGSTSRTVPPTPGASTV
jgi:hydroxyacylglutathione hydrolase